jgi:glutamate-1-semialdehyde 2,1-aminomutase
MERSKSQAEFRRARQLMPGGVNSPARAFGAVGGEPIVFQRGHGAFLEDLDGNRYIDYVLSWGPMILGHCHPEVTAAIHAAVDRGTSFGAPTVGENELAEQIIRAMPSIERVRLVNSGTEATMSAIRLARGYTGREMIVKFAGNYHGHVDSLLVAAGSAAATLSVPDSPGVTRGTSADTIVVQYNHPQQLAEQFQRCGDRIAAVIFEPFVGNMGCVRPTAEFVKTLVELAQRYGALLICDEVMTGFRVAFGGAQSLLGITPDLTTLGKIVGGGMPIGAYGGRAEIMNQVLPAGKVFQAGTLSGNPIATAAGAATLKILRDTDPYPRLQQLGRALGNGLRDAATRHGLETSLERIGSMLTLFFQPETVRDWPTASRSRTDLYARYFWGLIDRGVYMPCSQFEALFLSIAHQDSDIAHTIAAADEVFAEMANRPR